MLLSAHFKDAIAEFKLIISILSSRKHEITIHKILNQEEESKKFKGYDVLVAYAVKANSNQAILRLLAKRGAGADVVSYGEMLRAIKAGIPTNKIVFSGVGKTELEISNAIEQRILQFNIESYQEFLTIEEIAREKKIKANIAIRINPDVAAGGHPKISTGKKTDKFGISPAFKIPLISSNFVGPDINVVSKPYSLNELANAYPCFPLDSFEINLTGSKYSRVGPAVTKAFNFLFVDIWLK